MLFAIQFFMISAKREGACSSILSHVVHPGRGIGDDTNVRAKELFGLFLADIIVGSHVNKDGVEQTRIKQ